MTRGTGHVGEKISGNMDSTCTSELECFRKLNSILILFSLLFLKDALGPLNLRALHQRQNSKQGENSVTFRAGKFLKQL